MNRIKGKIEKIKAQNIHERISSRVEAGIGIWVVEKKNEPLSDSVVVEDDESDENLFANIQSVAGTLIDISEGGAAISVDLNLGKGDRVEFWSADSGIVLSNLSAGVVSVEKSGEKPILHLHFIDPELRELRLAIADISARGKAAV